MPAEAPKPHSPDVATEINEAQQGYIGAFLEIASLRLQMPVENLIIERLEEGGNQVSLRLEADKDEDPINLPENLQALIAQCFRGFPINNETFQPELRVTAVSFLRNRAAIDVEPTIETPKREGKEKLFITFPDRSRAVSSRLIFNIHPSGDYIVEFGNPNGRSEWIFSSTRPPRPYQGKRHQLTPDAINDLTALAHAVNARPHSDLRIHKIHS